MRNNSTWGSDRVLKQIILHVELFALALLLRTDIWIYSTEIGNEWMLFSGRGGSLIDALTLPVVNTAGPIYLNHNGLHYEPVLGLGKSNYYRRSHTISVYICLNKFPPPFHFQRVYKFWSQIQLYLAPEFL